MPIISVRDNKNNRWKRSADIIIKKTAKKKRKKKKQREKKTRGEAEVKVSNVELFLSTILKQKRIIWVKACCHGV